MLGTKPWVQSPSTTYTRHRVHTCNASTWKVEAGKANVQGCPQLHNELEASLGYMRSCLKKPESDFYSLSRRGSGKSGQGWRNQPPVRLSWHQVGETAGRPLSVRLERTELAGQCAKLRIKSSTEVGSGGARL